MAGDALSDEGGDRLFKMRTVTRRTGFSPALLRAWERRHGLLEPRRTEGGHRLYTEADLQVLLGVKSLLDEGKKAEAQKVWDEVMGSFRRRRGGV